MEAGDQRDTSQPGYPPAVTVRHRLGEISVEDGEVVNRMHIQGTLFRKPRTIEQRWAIAHLSAVRRYRDDFGLHVTFYRVESGIGEGVQHCLSEDDLNAFVEHLVRINPAIETNSSLADPALPKHDAEANRNAGPIVDVVTYRDASHYQRDAARRVADGWTIKGQSQDASRAHVAGKVGTAAVTSALFMSPAVGAASMLIPQRKPGAITITWVKEPAVVSDATPRPASRDATLSTELDRLARLHESGVLSDAEFAAAKAKLLS